MVSVVLRRGVVDVINLRGGIRPGTEEKDEEDVVRVPCVMALDMAREMEGFFLVRDNLR